MLKNVTREDNDLVLHFDHAEGLKAAKVFVCSDAEGEEYTLGKEGVIIERAQKGKGVLIIRDAPAANPRGFVLIDEQGGIHEAEAKIKGSTILVRVPADIKPVTVAGGGAFKEEERGKTAFLPNCYNAVDLPVTAFYYKLEKMSNE